MKAIFLDRDGVLIKDNHLITNKTDVEVLEGVNEALKVFITLGFELFLVSNQSVVARGMMSESECFDLNHWILEKVTGGNIPFKSISLCFDHPDAQVENYRKNSSFRKPENGAIENIIEKYEISRENSYMVGDRKSDIIAGNLSGLKTILIGESSTSSIKYFNEYPGHLENEDEKFKSLLEFSESLTN